MSGIIHFCYIIKTINLSKKNYVKLIEVKNKENSLQDIHSRLRRVLPWFRGKKCYFQIENLKKISFYG